MNHADIIEPHLELKIFIGLGKTTPFWATIRSPELSAAGHETEPGNNDYFEYGSVLTTMGYVFHAQAV